MSKNREILKQALADEREKQQESLVIDFDKAFEEERQRAITVKWQGKEYQIPDTPPEWFHLMTLRNEGVFSDDQNDLMIRKLFGEAFSEAMNKAGQEDNWLNMRMVNEKLLAPIIQKWYGVTMTDTTKKKETPESSSGRGAR